jgi:hypothetical protein
MYVELIGDKQCQRCRKVKSLHMFNMDRSAPGGYHGYCKDCRRETRGSKVKTIGGKVCPRCEEYKPASGFAYNGLRRDRLQAHCRECMSVQNVIVMQHKADRLLKANPVPAINRGWIGWRMCA